MGSITAERAGPSTIRGLWRLASSGPTPIFGLIVLSVALGFTWHSNYGRSAGIDFYQFWLVGGATERGAVASVYSVEGRQELTRIGNRIAALPGGSKRLLNAARTREIFENFSTPFLYSSFRWFNTGDYDRDYTRFQLLCFAALIGAILFFGRALGYGPVPAFLMLLAVVLGFRPALSDLLVGNVSRLELGGIALALLLLGGTRHWRALAAGAVLGLLLLFKPNILFAVVLLLLVWVASGRWARLLWHGAGITLGCAVAVAVSWSHWGSLRPWLDWVAAMGRIEQDSVLTSSAGNFGFARALMEMGLPDPSLALTGGLSAAAAVAIWLGSRRTARRPATGKDDLRLREEDGFRTEILAAAAGLAIPLLGFRLAWMHYFVLALPLFACGLRPGAFAAPAGRAGHPLRFVVAVAGALLLFGGPTYLLRSQGPAPPALQYSAGTALLLLLALVDLGRGSGPGGQDDPALSSSSRTSA